MSHLKNANKMPYKCPNLLQIHFMAYSKVAIKTFAVSSSSLAVFGKNIFSFFPKILENAFPITRPLGQSPGIRPGRGLAMGYYPSAYRRANRIYHL